jgi:hypothetical protein
MATIDITGGPSKDELVSRMLSDLPVTFLTSGGPVTVLIEEMQEPDQHSDQVSFIGRVVVGSHIGARVAGQYDGQAMIGTLEESANGP